MLHLGCKMCKNIENFEKNVKFLLIFHFLTARQLPGGFRGARQMCKNIENFEKNVKFLLIFHCLTARQLPGGFRGARQMCKNIENFGKILGKMSNFC